MLSRSCRPSGTPFRGTTADRVAVCLLCRRGPRRDSSRLVNEVAHWCGRGVIAPPAPLGPGWRVDGGGVMARHWQDACVDAVAKLPPLRAPRFSETIRVGLGAFLSVRAATPRPDSWMICDSGALAVPSIR